MAFKFSDFPTEQKNFPFHLVLIVFALQLQRVLKTYIFESIERCEETVVPWYHGICYMQMTL